LGPYAGISDKQIGSLRLVVNLLIWALRGKNPICGPWGLKHASWREVLVYEFGFSANGLMKMAGFIVRVAFKPQSNYYCMWFLNEKFVTLGFARMYTLLAICNPYYLAKRAHGKLH
jgi:hypothetical protein